MTVSLELSSSFEFILEVYQGNGILYVPAKKGISVTIGKHIFEHLVEFVYLGQCQLDTKEYKMNII